MACKTRRGAVPVVCPGGPTDTQDAKVERPEELSLHKPERQFKEKTRRPYRSWIVGGQRHPWRFSTYETLAFCSGRRKVVVLAGSGRRRW
jgi:hypothetical protein